MFYIIQPEDGDQYGGEIVLSEHHTLLDAYGELDALTEADLCVPHWPAPCVVDEDGHHLSRPLVH